MAKPAEPLPYFGVLLQLMERHPVLAQSFGRHVHWGYWPNPPTAKPDAAGFAEAAERLTLEVCAAAQISAGQRVLDVGCGFGGTVASLNECQESLQLHGLNIEMRQLQRAKQQVKPIGQNTAAWVNADACALPFKPETLDAVLAVECIFHFPSRLAFFREAFRVLKPGGRLALSDFLITPCLRPAAWLIRQKPFTLGFYGDCNVEYSFQAYRELAARTGFDVIVERDITANTLPSYDFIRSLQQQIPFFSLSAALETLFIEYASRLGLMRYGILALQKPG